MTSSEPTFRGRLKKRMNAQYHTDSRHSDLHQWKKRLDSGAHLVPIIYFMTMMLSMWLCFVLWYVNDRDFQSLCMDIYDRPEQCHSSREWTFPTISYTGQRSPEWYIFSVALSIGSVMQFMTVYYVHRRAWAAALFDNRGPRQGTLESEPRIYCIPCCCCSEGFGCTSKTCRPKLKCMLKASEITGYISAFFLFFVGWARMTYSYQLHNLCAYLFFGGGLIYMPLFTLAQHQIKKKCPARFKAPWRYFAKVTVIVCLIIFGIGYMFVVLDLMSNCGENWATSGIRRTGFPIGEYLAAHFVGVFLLTHFEDIRHDSWYLKDQIERLEISKSGVNSVNSRAHTTGNAGFGSAAVHSAQPDGVSTFPAPHSYI